MYKSNKVMHANLRLYVWNPAAGALASLLAQDRWCCLKPGCCCAGPPLLSLPWCDCCSSCFKLLPPEEPHIRYQEELGIVSTRARVDVTAVTRRGARASGAPATNAK